ncbi:MAG: RnfABCDGE type electron transport complex subunit B [Desulfatiglans sp.]|jgi:RnfABCDGE-type electron transport complex B subunit|nr:RnfABCDGE type electron transport complex subunit B [Desulfatiglans sp.]
MTFITIAISACTLFLLAVAISWILGWANIKFKVVVNPKIEEVLNALPGANCGGCGYVGCSDYAAAVVDNNVPVNRCTVGGESCANVVARIMGVDAGQMLKSYAIVHCGSKLYERLLCNDYHGEKSCIGASQVAGIQGCTYGCLGLGDCIEACKYDAIHVTDGLATVDYDKCIGCGACARVCPRGIITIVPFNENSIPVVACSNKDTGKESREVCQKACIGCKACSKISDIFIVEGTLSRADYSSCNASKYEETSQAKEKCPTKCIRFIGRM